MDIHDPNVDMERKRIVSATICLMFVLGMMLVAKADAADTYSTKVTTTSRGEYNITVKGATMKPSLYRVKKGKSQKVSVVYKRSGSTYVMNASLDKKTTYYVRSAGGKKPTVKMKANLDRYSKQKTARSKGIMWTPKEGSYQPYDLSFIYTKQIVYLTKEEAMVYAMNLDKSKYLKLLDTGIKITVFVANLGWSQTLLGQIMCKVGKPKLVAVAKIIVKEYGGIKFVPSMKSTVKKAVEEKTNGYQTGLKIVTTYSDKGGFTNSYHSWDEKNSSVEGKKYLRGQFTEDVVLKGWY